MCWKVDEWKLPILYLIKRNLKCFDIKSWNYSQTPRCMIFLKNFPESLAGTNYHLLKSPGFSKSKFSINAILIFERPCSSFHLSLSTSFTCS